MYIIHCTYIIVHNMFLQEHLFKTAVMFLREHFPSQFDPLRGPIPLGRWTAGGGCPYMDLRPYQPRI